MFGFSEKRPVINMIMLIGEQFLAAQKNRQELVTYQHFIRIWLKCFVSGVIAFWSHYGSMLCLECTNTS